MATLTHFVVLVVLSGYVVTASDSIITPPRNTRVERLWCPPTAGRGETPVTCLPTSECPPERQLWSGGAEKDDPPDRRIATCHGGGLVCCLPPASRPPTPKSTATSPTKTRRKRQEFRYDWISDDNLSLVRAVLDQIDARERRQQSPLRVSFSPPPTPPPGWVISVVYGPSGSAAVSEYQYGPGPPGPLIPSYRMDVYQPATAITSNREGAQAPGQSQSQGPQGPTEPAPSQMPGGASAGFTDIGLGADRIQVQNGQTPPLSNALEPPTSTRPSSGRQPGIISQKMCERFAELTSHDVNLSPLLPGHASIPVRINDCSNYNLVVVGGTNASSGEFPHMAALGFQSGSEREWICGGSLISEQWLLTAAHCLHTQLGSPRWVRLGWLGGTDTPEVEATVAAVHSHPGFSQRSKYNDLGLIQVSEPIPLSLRVRPACLPPPPSPFDTSLRTGSVAVAIGWGKTSYTGESSSSLLKVSLRVVDPNKCKRAYEAEMFGDFLNQGITKNLICAGDERGKDTCQGDSGGPLQTAATEQSKCVFRVVGVTVYGKACGIGVPGLYTNVAEYLGWIEDYVWPV